MFALPLRENWRWSLDFWFTAKTGLQEIWKEVGWNWEKLHSKEQWRDTEESKWTCEGAIYSALSY